MTKKEICYLKMLLYCWIFKGILIGIFGDTFLWVFFSVCFPRVYVWIKSYEWNEIQILAVPKVYVLFTPKLVWKHFEKYYFFLKCKVYCCSLYVNIEKEVREKSSYAACVSLVFLIVHMLTSFQAILWTLIYCIFMWELVTIQKTQHR